MFVKVGKVRISCLYNCKNCPAKEADWKALLEGPPCCGGIWVPARFRSLATNKDRTVDKRKALRLFLQELEVL